MTVLTFSNDMAPVPESIPAKAAAKPLLDRQNHTITYVEEVIANTDFCLHFCQIRRLKSWQKACLGVPPLLFN